MLKMIRIKTKKSCIHKNAFYLLKFYFQILCFRILLYQFIDITNVYLNFPYEVKLSIKSYSGLTRKHPQLVIADFHTILHKQSVKCPYTWSIGFKSQHSK
jgi:hypothetical protein